MASLYCEQNNKKNESIFNMICLTLDVQGRLPQDFALPWSDDEGGLRYAPGAMDGIALFHANIECDDGDVQDLFALLKNACDTFSEENVAQLCKYIASRSALCLSNPLLELIRERKDNIEPKGHYWVAYKLMTESDQVEAVKLGIMLMRFFDLQKDEECCRIIMMLGKYDEFTLYSLTAADSRDDYNALVFQLANETHGWGKIHAVRYLDVDTEEIRDWIITSGCSNRVMNEYLALVCANKGNLLSYLQREDLSEEFFCGAEIILSAMLNEGPVDGISAYECAEPALTRYLFHAEKSNRLSTFRVVWEIKEWLPESDILSKDAFIAQCDAILNRPYWEKIMLKSLDSDDRQVVWEGSLTAKRIGVDISARLFEIVQKDPMNYTEYISMVCQSSELAEQLFELYEKVLPLNEIDEKGENLSPESVCLSMLLQELGAFPGKGLSLIEKGLSLPGTRNVNMALRALQDWQSQSYKLTSIAPCLMEPLKKLSAEDVHEDYREFLKKLRLEEGR